MAKSRSCQYHVLGPDNVGKASVCYVSNNPNAKAESSRPKPGSAAGFSPLPQLRITFALNI